MLPLLDDLRVIELSAFVAVPLGGLTLAQMGAEVIRVDPLGGGVDAGRWPVTAEGKSLYWAGLNGGKRSMAIDLRSAEGRRIVEKLIVTDPTVGPSRTGPTTGGIIITNLPYRWLSYEELRRFRPDLIMVRLTGHHDGAIGVDYTVNARVGYPLSTGPADSPTKHVLPAWDVVAGHQVALAVLAAERRRTKTGEGAEVSIALADVAMATVAQLGHFGEVIVNDHDRPSFGNYLYGAYGKDFATADGRWVEIVAITRRQWRSLVELTATTTAIEALESELDVDFSESEGTRFATRERITEILAPWFASRTMDQIAPVLDAARILWAPYQTFRQLVEDDPYASTANPLFADVEHPGIGTVRSAGSTLAFADLPRAAPSPARLLGADTMAILSEAGYTNEHLIELRRDGVIG